jgi:hypothetical protein
MTDAYRQDPLETVTLRYEAPGLIWTYSLTASTFVVEWKSGQGTGRREHSIRDMSPLVTTATGRAPQLHPHALQRGLFAGGLAIVLYFSEVQRLVPLGSLFFAVVAFYHLARVNWLERRSSWTTFTRRDGTTVATVDEKRCDRAALAKMTHALRERCSALGAGLP